MNTSGYIEALENGLLPYIANVDSCLLVPGSCKTIQAYTWSESPNLNPIEYVWHELKEYLRWVVKLTTKDRLISGIKEFWGTD